jgi:hypothetical protein
VVAVTVPLGQCPEQFHDAGRFVAIRLLHQPTQMIEQDVPSGRFVGIAGPQPEVPRRAPRANDPSRWRGRYVSIRSSVVRDDRDQVPARV